MGQNKNRYNKSFNFFKRFEHEILLDINENLLDSNLLIIENTVFHIGTNELHHMVKYYQKIILNTLFFKQKKFLYEYNLWLYRVYYHRDVDLEFFRHLNQLFQKISSSYIDHKFFIPIDEIFNYILDHHDYFKENASKKTILIDCEKEATLLTKYLITNDKKNVIKNFAKDVSSLDEFFLFYDQIIYNTMKNIGFLWERGEVSIGQEHIASNLLEEVLLEILHKFSAKKTNNKHIFLSSAPNELHGLGVKIASIIFEKLGYKVTSLGVNIPAKEIKKAIREFQPDLIIFSATLQISLIDIAFLIDELEQDKETFTKKFQIGIAGNGFEQMVHPAKTLKANFYISNLKTISTITP